MKIKGNKKLVVRFEIDPEKMQRFVLWTAMALADYRKKYAADIATPEQDVIKMQEDLLLVLFNSVTFSRLDRLFLAASLPDDSECALTDLMRDNERKEYLLVRDILKKQLLDVNERQNNGK